MEDYPHLLLVEEYISKGKSIERFVEERLNLIFQSLKIYDDVKIKSDVIQKIGYEIDEVLSKIDTLETNRKSKFI
ncbi:hypothetical protein [Aliarcobacter cryaerophilus]|uniref:hypothetical protein n=1 Tax=Aliarcobacter cryaerophilus TaxID=28198 RepID=UPI0021B1BB5C|nr:hypothetical protein [Aliarcobacter cryaerophilus]MCT7483315.1 hypothetical protein [Aliarcobacter cryaerophilus]